MRRIWQRLTPAQQYGALAFGAATCATIAFVIWIAEGVYRAALSGAMEPRVFYLQGLFAPVARDLAEQAVLTAETRDRISELAHTTGSGHRFSCICIWAPSGTVVYGSEATRGCVPSSPAPGFKTAMAGTVSFAVERDKDGSNGQLPDPPTLLQIFVPIRNASGDRIEAVAMVHEVVDHLHPELDAARAKAWSIVVAAVATTATTFLVLVWRGGRKEGDRRMPGAQPKALLRNREPLEASASAGALSGRPDGPAVRQIAADLHDGAAQLIGLALLRLDNLDSQAVARRDRQLDQIRTSLQDALAEIRALASGVSLPGVRGSSPEETIRLAVAAHERRTGTSVDCEVTDMPPKLPALLQTCLYRFIQEGLNNAYKHAQGEGQVVRAVREPNGIVVSVSDTGPGVDEPERAIAKSRGLAGLRARVESLGGKFEFVSEPDRGTRLVARFGSWQPRSNGGDPGRYGFPSEDQRRSH